MESKWTSVLVAVNNFHGSVIARGNFAECQRFRRLYDSWDRLFSGSECRIWPSHVNQRHLTRVRAGSSHEVPEQ